MNNYILKRCPYCEIGPSVNIVFNGMDLYNPVYKTRMSIMLPICPNVIRETVKIIINHLVQPLTR